MKIPFSFLLRLSLHFADLLESRTFFISTNTSELERIFSYIRIFDVLKNQFRFQSHQEYLFRPIYRVTGRIQVPNFHTQATQIV